MAKSLLLYGRDAQIRRLAQEIITDQQSGNSTHATLAEAARGRLAKFSQDSL